MPTEDELSDFVENEAPNLIEGIGDTFVDSLRQEQDDPIVYNVLCSHGNNYYVLATATSVKFVQVQFRYELIGDLITLSSGDEGNGEPRRTAVRESSIPEDIIEEANSEADNIIESLSPNQAEKLRWRLIEIISRAPAVGYEVNDRDGRPFGFNVTAKIFPYDEVISLSEYEQSVQSVMSVGVPGRLFLRLAYGIVSGDSGSSGFEEFSQRQDPTFQ